VSKHSRHIVKHYITFPELGEAEIIGEPMDGTPAWAWTETKDGQLILHVVYVIHDDMPPDPQEDYDGEGKIILFGHDHSTSVHKKEGMAAFGLDEDGEPDLEGAYGHLYFNGDTKDLNKLGLFFWRSGDHYHNGAPYRDYYGSVDMMEDDKVAIVQKLWEKYISDGTIGNKYALPIHVQDQSYTILTVHDAAYSDYYRHGGVWIADQLVLDNLDREKGETEIAFRKRLLRYAKSCVQMYEDWVNGATFLAFHATYTQRDGDWEVQDSGNDESMTIFGWDDMEENVRDCFVIPGNAERMTV
jgi:hypothetical protein